jgi:hypothetical protein
MNEKRQEKPRLLGKHNKNAETIHISEINIFPNYDST